MQTIIETNKHLITSYRTRDAALAVANQLNADDDTCSYHVEAWRDRFVITVYDMSDNAYLGTL